MKSTPNQLIIKLKPPHSNPQNSMKEMGLQDVTIHIYDHRSSSYQSFTSLLEPFESFAQTNESNRIESNRIKSSSFRFVSAALRRMRRMWRRQTGHVCHENGFCLTTSVSRGRSGQSSQVKLMREGTQRKFCTGIFFSLLFFSFPFEHMYSTGQIAHLNVCTKCPPCSGSIRLKT